jgi:hypothetical protein
MMRDDDTMARARELVASKRSLGWIRLTFLLLAFLVAKNQHLRLTRHSWPSFWVAVVLRGCPSWAFVSPCFSQGGRAGPSP